MGCSDSHARDTLRRRCSATARSNPAGRLASKLTGTVRRGRGLMRHADWLWRFIGWLTLINFYPVLFAYNCGAHRQWRKTLPLVFRGLNLPGILASKNRHRRVPSCLVIRDYFRTRRSKSVSCSSSTCIAGTGRDLFFAIGIFVNGTVLFSLLLRLITRGVSPQYT